LPVKESQEIENLTGDDAKLFIAGWGLNENKTKSDVLMKANIPYFPHESCTQEYNELRKKHQIIKVKIQETQMCAFNRTSKVDA
jgi:Trypsin